MVPLSAEASTPEQAQGLATVFNGNLVRARVQAIENARRALLSQIMLMQLTPALLTANQEPLSKTIYKNHPALITEFTIIAEGIKSATNQYFVDGRGQVDLPALNRQLRRLGLLPNKTLPRVLVMFLGDACPANSLHGVLTKQLQKSGFHAVRSPAKSCWLAPLNSPIGNVLGVVARQKVEWAVVVQAGKHRYTTENSWVTKLSVPITVSWYDARNQSQVYSQTHLGSRLLAKDNADSIEKTTLSELLLVTSIRMIKAGAKKAEAHQVKQGDLLLPYTLVFETADPEVQKIIITTIEKNPLVFLLNAQQYPIYQMEMRVISQLEGEFLKRHIQHALQLTELKMLPTTESSHRIIFRKN